MNSTWKPKCFQQNMSVDECLRDNDGVEEKRWEVLTKFSDKARVFVKRFGEVLEEHGVVFSGHVAEFGCAVAVVF